MPEQSRPALPVEANLDWLRKKAKRRLHALRGTRPDAKLADAQYEVAKEFGFASWRAVKQRVRGRASGSVSASVSWHAPDGPMKCVRWVSGRRARCGVPGRPSLTTMHQATTP